MTSDARLRQAAQDVLAVNETAGRMDPHDYIAETDRTMAALRRALRDTEPARALDPLDELETLRVLLADCRERMQRWFDTGEYVEDTMADVVLAQEGVRRLVAAARLSATPSEPASGHGSWCSQEGHGDNAEPFVHGPTCRRLSATPDTETADAD